MNATIENRPAVYLAGLSDEELLSYAASYAVTALEIQLHERLAKAANGNTKEDVICPCCGTQYFNT